MEQLFIVKKPLDKWLQERDRKLFPMGFNYSGRFDQIAEYLNKFVHTEVEKGAILSEIKKGNVDPDKIIYLNNHGPGHVEKVIEKASDILIEFKTELSSYEGYLLLTSIHFHDVGNIFGRKDHEKKCGKIMRSLGNVAGFDSIEKRTIIEIASVHGGCYDGSKNTIASLEPDGEVDLLGKPIRKRFLAALLRFADELADDRSRASRFMLENQIIPVSSEIYHAYSKCLHSVTINNCQINLTFEIYKEDALKQYVKNHSQSFLLDEIFERTLKMHLERIYCMRFLRPYVNLDRIHAKIEVCSDVSSDRISEVLWKNQYMLEEAGYPKKPENGIYEICPDLEGINGQWLNNKLGG